MLKNVLLTRSDESLIWNSDYTRTLPKKKMKERREM